MEEKAARISLRDLLLLSRAGVQSLVGALRTYNPCGVAKKSFFFFIIIYLFFVVVDLCCFARAFSSCGEWRLLFAVLRRLLFVVASLVEHWL